MSIKKNNDYNINDLYINKKMVMIKIIIDNNNKISFIVNMLDNKL